MSAEGPRDTLGLDATAHIAAFADYENVAIGAADAGLEPFDINLVSAWLLEKGKIIVKKAYSDWSRYNAAKRPLHEAGFELVEVPHARFSGKNSADIRMVVDAIDLAHTKPHIEVFALITGDSDFSPLVQKLRENAKAVVGIGVKASTSKLLMESCDEFIFYDDLVRESRRGSDRSRQEPQEADGDPVEAVKWVADTADALLRDRGQPVWGSHVKQVLKRKRPHFRESHYGFRSFNDVLEDASERGLLQIRKDDTSGGYRVVGLD